MFNLILIQRTRRLPVYEHGCRRQCFFSCLILYIIKKKKKKQSHLLPSLPQNTIFIETRRHRLRGEDKRESYLKVMVKKYREAQGAGEDSEVARPRESQGRDAHACTRTHARALGTRVRGETSLYSGMETERGWGERPVTFRLLRRGPGDPQNHARGGVVFGGGGRPLGEERVFGS